MLKALLDWSLRSHLAAAGRGAVPIEPARGQGEQHEHVVLLELHDHNVRRLRLEERDDSGQQWERKWVRGGLG